MERKVTLVRQLNTFDVTSLVVGSIIGADIYVAAALGVRLVGPASLLVWVLAGVVAIVVALSFAYSASMVPKVGGPYAYVKEVSGPFPAFLVGWGLFLAEWLSLAVFPIAFVRYVGSLVPGLGPGQEIVLKGLFIVIILVTNIFGIKAAGRFNDVLTVGKLAPLLLLMASGVLFVVLKPQIAISHFHPFVTGGLRDAGKALVLIFWAYAGFELATLPAEEIQNPERTIAKAIVFGMLIVISFYLITNFVIIAAVDQATLASSGAPLMAGAAAIFAISPLLSTFGRLVAGAGALVSITGADESGTIGTSRLAFAMSVDGLMPRVFSVLWRPWNTPYIGLGLICLTAFFASASGSLSGLINASVFLLSFAYLATCVSTILLEGKYPEKARNLGARRIVSLLGVFCSLVLMSQVDLHEAISASVLLGMGIPIYVLFSPRRELYELKVAFLSREAVLVRTYEQGERFLAHPLRHIKWYIYRLRGRDEAWRTAGPKIIFDGSDKAEGHE